MRRVDRRREVDLREDGRRRRSSHSALVSFGSSSTLIAGTRAMGQECYRDRKFFVYSVNPKMSSIANAAERRRWGRRGRLTEATELYDVARWGQGYFSINDQGHLQVHPTKEPARGVDLKRLIDRLELRGLSAPILLRFTDILKHRLGEIHSAFQSAIAQHQYQGRYSCVYPIKVNQQRQVVEEVLNFGRQYGFGLEAGSKPELLAVVALAENDTPIICNGFKDAEFIEMAMLAQKMGRLIIPVVEKYTELELILHYAEKVGVRPNIGMRVKLAARGSGRWQSSGGYRSKFGLTVTEILRGLEELQAARGMEDCFKLLHFHLGSQITHIRIIKNALNEAARVYCELAKQGAGLQYMDVGGGLGVDYDGSQTNFESSMNYTLQEYANDVVYHIQTVCDEAGRRASDHHLRERPRGVRVSQHADLQRAGHDRVRRREDPDGRSRTSSSSRWSI